MFPATSLQSEGDGEGEFYRSEVGRRRVYKDLVMVETIGDRMASRAIELGERTMERKSILSRCMSVRVLVSRNWCRRSISRSMTRFEGVVTKTKRDETKRLRIATEGRNL